MAIQDKKSKQIELLQNNLQTIRKLAGWSIDDLGERIGVTKQTISNIENKRTTMTLTQYIAIRTVLDHEMQEHLENEVLIKSVALLLDEEESLSKEDYVRIKESIDTIAAATAGGAEKTALANMFNTVLGTAAFGADIGFISPLGIAGGVAGSLWLKKLMQEKEQPTNRKEVAADAT